jgi:UDP-2,3-diacylglucosamine hydrolase
MAYCFISDLHLQESRPDITKAFLGFLENTAYKAERLYILGDLFEAWIGDDDQNNLISEIQAALLKINKTTKIFFLHGNRDFLIGTEFASSSGLEILNDPTIEEMFGNRVLLMHGDLLCIEDHDYQAFRKTSRDAKWQDEFLNKSIEERREIAHKLRTISKEATGIKKEEIMDVSATEVIRTMEESAVNLLIHGHTHRPKSHKITVNDKPAERIVLGDWDAYGWYLWMDSSSCELKNFSIS